MDDIVSLVNIRAARQAWGLEERVRRARRARAAEAAAAAARQEQIRDRARVAVTAIMGEPADPTSAS